MAASTTVQLILDAVNNASGNIKSVTNDLKAQQNQIKQLQAAENARLAAQKAALAQAKAIAAQGQFDADKTLKTQKAAALANQAAESAANKAAIAQKKYQLAIDQSATSGEKLKTSISGFDTGISRLGSLASTVIGGTVVAAFAAATAGAVGFANAIGNAIDQEAKMVNMATTVMRIRSSDRESATGVVQNLDRELISKSGGIVDVNTSRQLARTFFDDALGVFDNVDATRITADLSNRLASIIGTEGSDPGQFTNVLTDFLSGSTSIDALRTRDVLNDTGINKILIPLLEAGGKEIKNLSVAERFKVLQQAIETALPDEALLAQAQTTKGLLQASFNKLFGAGGLFDVQRDLFPDEGITQSVFETFKVTLAQLIGRDGIFSQIGRILQSSGFDVDPMLALNQGLTRFNAWLMNLNGALSQIQSVDAANFGALLGQGLSGLINNMFASVDAFAIGQSIAGALNNIASFITTSLSGVDWGLVGSSIAQGIAGFFSTLDWNVYMVAAGAIIGAGLLGSLGAWAAGIAGTIAAALTGAVGLFIAGIAAGMVLIGAAMIQLINASIQTSTAFWGQVGAAISAGFTNLTAYIQAQWAALTANVSAAWANITASANAAWAGMMATISAAVNNIGSSASSLISSLGSTISSLIQSAISTAQSALSVISSLISSLGSTISNAINSAIATAQSALGAISSSIQALGDAITSAINSAISTAQSVFGGIADLVSSLASTISSSISSAISGAQSAISNLIPGGETGASGVLPAAGTYAYTPAGGAVTNNSGGNVTVETLVVQALPGMNESLLADLVLERLGQRVRVEQLGIA